MRISLMNGSWNKIAQHISSTINEEIKIKEKTSVSGGCINQCWKVLDDQNKHWFVKTNQTSLLNMFIAESEGLKEITQSQSIRTPKSICHGSTADFSYLVLEYIPLMPLTNQKEAGKRLAQMHQYTSEVFGWKRDNTIGSTHQSNQQNNSWISFWQNERLLYQLDLAVKNGYSQKAYDDGLKLIENLSSFFSTYQVQPSLLHGDLWGGNCASDKKGNPVIFDPAVYYGDRETDIAMTELFGGFSHEFYSSYNQTFALDQDYKTRKNLYNLYHILNHFNLFGGSYASQASNITLKLLSEI